LREDVVESACAAAGLVLLGIKNETNEDVGLALGLGFVSVCRPGDEELEHPKRNL
jgi:hypothetical protein